MSITAYLAIKFHADHKNKLSIEQISAALMSAGIRSICVTRDLEKWGTVHFEPADLMLKSFEAIDTSDFVVIDLTEKGVGLGIEAGYAWAKGKPIITIAKAGSDISTTLQGISEQIVLYETFDDLNALFAQFKQQFEQLHSTN